MNTTGKPLGVCPLYKDMRVRLSVEYSGSTTSSMTLWVLSLTFGLVIVIGVLTWTGRILRVGSGIAALRFSVLFHKAF